MTENGVTRTVVGIKLNSLQQPCLGVFLIGSKLVRIKSRRAPQGVKVPPYLIGTRPSFPSTLFPGDSRRPHWHHQAELPPGGTWQHPQIGLGGTKTTLFRLERSRYDQSNEEDESAVRAKNEGERKEEEPGWSDSKQNFNSVTCLLPPPLIKIKFAQSLQGLQI